MTAAATRPLRVALIWNQTIVEDVVLHDPHDVTIGDAPGVTFPVGTRLGPTTTLFRYSSDGFLLRLVPGMTGRLMVRGRPGQVAQTLQSYRNEPVEVLVGPGDWGIIGIGAAALYFQFLPPQKKPRAPWFGMDRDLVQGLAFAAVVHLCVFILGYLLMRLDPVAIPPLIEPERVARFLVEQPRPEEPAGDTPDPGMRDRDEGGRAHRADEGRVGTRESRERQTQIPGKGGALPSDRVRNVGMLGVLGSSGGVQALEKVLSGVPNLESALRGLGSPRLVVGQGSGGWGLKGEGRGGGGTGDGVLFGAGAMGTGIGRGPGGLGKGGGGIGLKGNPRAEVRVEVQHGTPNVSGYLSPEQINRVVRAHSGALRACYETELQRIPSLRGRVVLYWRIGLDGRVRRVNVDSTSLSNARVEGCLTRQLRFWQFPEPDGGEVDVHYPFLFGIGGG